MSRRFLAPVRAPASGNRRNRFDSSAATSQPPESQAQGRGQGQDEDLSQAAPPLTSDELEQQRISELRRAEMLRSGEVDSRANPRPEVSEEERQRQLRESQRTRRHSVFPDSRGDFADPFLEEDARPTHPSGVDPRTRQGRQPRQTFDDILDSPPPDEDQVRQERRPQRRDSRREPRRGSRDGPPQGQNEPSQDSFQAAPPLTSDELEQQQIAERRRAEMMRSPDVDSRDYLPPEIDRDPNIISRPGNLPAPPGPNPETTNFDDFVHPAAPENEPRDARRAPRPSETARRDARRAQREREGQRRGNRGSRN